MAETRGPRSKGKKLDSIISKLKIHTPVEESAVTNEERNENVESGGEADFIPRRSKRKPGKILRYKIDDDDDDDDDEKREEEKSPPENDSNEDNKKLDDSLPKTIFEELPNGEAEFEEGEDTTVLFLPSEEIQVKAGPSEDYCHGLLDDQDEEFQEGVEEKGKRKEKKKKKKKSKSYESDESLDEDGLPRRVTCTACGRHVNPAHGTILRHPILNVLVCKKCNQYYNSGPFTRDEYGIEEQCRWCGDGGDLICCDECEKVYCKPCIQRNCGKTYLKNLLNAPEDFKWLCFVCNKDKPMRHIQRLRKKCELVMEALERIKAQKAHFKSKKGKQPSIVVGPTPLERRSRLTCLSEDIGIKGEGFSSSGESPTKKTFPKEDLPAELFSKTESEEENEKEREELKEKKNEKESKKDDVVESGEDEKEKENKMAEDVVDHSSSKDIEKAKKKADVEDEGRNEIPEEIPTVSQEEVEKQTKRRRSSQRLQSSDQSVKSDETNEEETKSNASTSSKTEKAISKSSDEETIGRRKTHSQKDGTVEPEEGDISDDELAVDQEQKEIEDEDGISGGRLTQRRRKAKNKEKEISGENLTANQEQEASQERKEKNSMIKKQSSIEVEEEGNENLEQRVTRSRKETKNKEEEKTKKKNEQNTVEELNDKDVIDEETVKNNKTENIQESSPDVEEMKEKEKKRKKDVMITKVKQEEQDSSEDLVTEKRPSGKSKENANKVLKTRSCSTEKETNQNNDVKKEVIFIESSEEEEEKEEMEQKGNKKKKGDKASAKREENKTDNISLRWSRRNKEKENLRVKSEKDSNSDSESEMETKKGRKRKRKQESSEEEFVAEEPSEDEREEMTYDESESEEDKVPLKKLKQISGKKSKLRESSSESSSEKKKLRKTNVKKKKKQLEESSESESDLSSSRRKLQLKESSESEGELKKKSRKTVKKKKKGLEESSESEYGSEKEEDYILDESSESDAEKTSDESDEESDEGVKVRKRGLQKQTRKRPRPMESSSSESDKQSSEESDVGIARRTRKRRQEESDSSDVGTKKRIKQKGKKSQKEKGENRRGKRIKSALDSDEDKSEEESSESISESPSESEEEEDKPKCRRSKRQKKTQKKKKKKAKKAATKPKKRRRIRKNSDSDEDDDDDEAEDKSPHKGRKKIRKLLTDEKLGEETQKARRLEEERRKRLLERTRILESEEIPKESWRMNSLVLEKDEETKEPLVEVHPHIIQHLKPHQAKGIQFMYNNVVDTVKAYKKGDPGGGCILAHCMGLGKTLQVVGLIHTLMNSDQLEFRTALIIAPLNTVLNWQVEFDKWLGVDDRMEVFVLKNAGPNNWCRADMLKQWHRYGGVMIMGYDMYRNLALCQRMRSKNQKKIFKQTLVDPGPDLVVCDEGHILRNDQSAISKTVNNIKTKRRIVLTGTPLQNNLIEYHCMMSFVKPNLLGTRREFMNTFGNPILNGQCSDSTSADVRLMKHRCHVLYKLLEGCVQRRDYSVLTPFLPPKHEYVLKIRLSEAQRKLYNHYLNTFVCPEGDDIARRGASLFSDYQALMRIWTHPWCLKLEAIRRSLRASFEDTDDSLDGFVVHSDEEEEESNPSSSEQSLSLSDDSDEGTKNKNKSKKPFQLKSSSEEESEDNTSDEEVMPQPTTRRATRSQALTKTEETKDVMKVEVNGDDFASSRTGSNTRSGAIFKEDVPVEKEWYDEFLTDEDEYNVELSGKMALLLEILADAEAVEEKVLVFSQSLVTLDLIERALGGGEVGGDRENWCRGCDYFRMDGSTSVQLRQRWSDIFNDVDNKTARLFLISTKAGGLGINLVAANRVIVFDVSWNPSHDVQSIFRVFRFGQTRPVYVYRLVSQGTMEEKIYERQVAKLSISERVIDKHQIERHFTAADLAELYTFNPEVHDEEKDQENLPKLPLPKDAVLADLINRMHPKWIVKYHEHDSLLQNVEAEELTEEECQVAWSVYEAQKDQAKYQERVRALQAAYAQQQLQQQRQAIPQNLQNNNIMLREMQQLQQQQLSERMSRYQPNAVRFRFLSQNPVPQARTDQLRHQLLQHVGASHPVYQVHAQSNPSTAGPSYQPMMSYLSQQQQHVLGQSVPSSQVVQLPQSQPLSHPRPTAPPPMRVLPPGAQYRR